MSEGAQWLAEHRDGWERVLDELRSRGWSVDLTCDMAPVQVEGTLPSGEQVYFRARGTGVTLKIDRDSPEPGSHWVGYADYTEGGEFAASYMSGADALRIIEALVHQWQEL